MKYQYRTITLTFSTDLDVEKMLNQQGKEGWKLDRINKNTYIFVKEVKTRRKKKPVKKPERINEKELMDQLENL